MNGFAGVVAAAGSIIAGLARLHLDAEMLDATATSRSSGLKFISNIYGRTRTDHHRPAPDRDTAEHAASHRQSLQQATNLVAAVTGSRVQEHPEQTANSSRISAESTAGTIVQLRPLSETNLRMCSRPRETNWPPRFRPMKRAVSYDPFGLTRLLKMSPERFPVSVGTGIIRLCRRHVPDHFRQGAR